MNVNLNMDEQRIDEWSLTGGCDNIRDNLLNFNFSAAIPKISFSSFFPLLYLDQLLISDSRLLDWFTIKALQRKSNKGVKPRWYENFKHNIEASLISNNQQRRDNCWLGKYVWDLLENIPRARTTRPWVFFKKLSNNGLKVGIGKVINWENNHYVVVESYSPQTRKSENSNWFSRDNNRLLINRQQTKLLQ